MQNLFRGLAVFAIVCGTVYGQGDRGSITGAVTDSSGAVVPNAHVEATNVATGTRSETSTTTAGAYSIPSIPAAVYNVNIQAPGFKTFTAHEVKVGVAETARVDARLEIGAAAETVNVTAEAELLKTASAEQSQNVSGETVNDLPLNFGGGAGAAGAIRNPLGFALLTPGVNNGSGGFSSGFNGAINGLPGGTARVMYAGQDATSGNSNSLQVDTQGSVEIMQEYTIQTSNYSAEYGGATSALINLTPKSGTNKIHGSAYEFWANDVLDARQNYLNQKPSERKNDFGLSIGGPIFIPKVYNGRNKSFFFFNVEEFINHYSAVGTDSVPTSAERGGDFSAVLGAQIGTDVLGRPLYQNEIFDSGTARVVNGRTVADPFTAGGQLNVIPQSLLDPVALKIQALIPSANVPGVLNNLTYNTPTLKTQNLPSFTLDQSLPHSGHASFYFSDILSHQFQTVGSLPEPISPFRDQHVSSQTYRFNYDQSFAPTLVFHAGAGYVRYYNPDSSPASVLNYDAVGKLGLIGGALNGFPRLTGLASTAYGGAPALGPVNANHYINDKLTTNMSLTWVHGRHVIKTGGDFHIDTWGDANAQGTTGVFNFAATQTTNLDQQQTLTGGGSLGFPYASFLIGRAATASVNAVKDPYTRRNGWSAFLQDNWKVTGKLTLDIGVRWDLQEWFHEVGNRVSELSLTAPDPAAGNLPGGVVYAGSGSGRCNCNMAPAYPYAIAPKLGVAYQLNSKTVVRGGFGVAYGQLGTTSWFTNNPNLFYGVGYQTLNFTNPAFGGTGATLKQGLVYDRASLTAATLDPSAGTIAGSINTTPPFIIDQNAGRPPRILQYNIGIQHQFGSDLAAEVSYVANRGVWEQDQNETSINGLNPATLKARGLDLSSPTTITLLNSTIGSAAAKAAGIAAPYAGFPTSATVAQALRPFPQYGNITDLWSPNGKSWYDSLQAKLTKRARWGLSGTVAFTWSKALNYAGRNNIFDRTIQKSIASYDQPLLLSSGINYEVPKYGSNKLVTAVTSGWTIGAVLAYGSGLPIAAPAQTGNPTTSGLLFLGNNAAFRNPGVPLYNVDINCHCFDPTKQVVLNPAAWSNPVPGQFGGSPYFGDFRFQRRPNESISFGRRFRLREKMWLQVRAEFFNPFNRTEFANPGTGSFNAAPTFSNGLLSGGYGVINSKAALAIAQRNGQLTGRLEW